MMAVRRALVRSNHVERESSSRSDGLKGGVCASEELETRMCAAFDRIGRGMTAYFAERAPEMLWMVFFFKFELGGEGPDCGQSGRIECGVTVARYD